MSQFDNVTVIRKANCYFDGKVSSRTVVFPDGSKTTLGVMLPGEYKFSTSSHEIMEILTGELDVLLPGASSVIHIKSGDTFEVPANTSFSVDVKTITDYCCSYS